MKHLLAASTLVGLGLLVAGIQAGAHHSFNEFYFENESITLTGEVTSFEYQNPHAWLHFLAEDDDGESIEVAAEWSNPNRLRRSGVTADTLQVGDLVVVTGSPGKDPDTYTVHLKSIQRPSDGWEWAEAQGRGGRGRPPRR